MEATKLLPIEKIRNYVTRARHLDMRNKTPYAKLTTIKCHNVMGVGRMWQMRRSMENSGSEQVEFREGVMRIFAFSLIISLLSLSKKLLAPLSARSKSIELQHLPTRLNIKKRRQRAHRICRS